MSISSFLKNIKLPKYKDLIIAKNKARDESKKIDINTIDVIFHTSNFKSSIKTKGIISRDTTLPIVYITIPENLAVFLIDDGIEIDIETGKQYIQVVENYPFNIILPSELEENYKLQYYKDLSDKKIGKVNKKRYEDTHIGYLIPILINNIPHNIVRVNLSEELSNNDHDYLTVSQKLLNELGTIRLLQSTNENKNDGLIIIGIIGLLIGMFLGSMITLYVVS